LVKTFSQGAAQADDITLLILRYKGPKAEERRTNAD
jgi:hypothetical protein